MRAAPSASMMLSGGTAPLLAVAVDDAAARQVVRRKLDADAVAGRDADEVATHAAGSVGDELVAVLELYLEHRVRQPDHIRGGALPGVHLDPQHGRGGPSWGGGAGGAADLRAARRCSR